MRKLRRVAVSLWLAAVFGLEAFIPAARGDIGDIISDFLYYEEELKIKNPANPVATILSGIGGRYLALVDSSGAVRVWDFETGRENTVDERWPQRVKAAFPNTRGANFIVADKEGRIYESEGLSFAVKTVLFEPGTSTDRVAVSSQGPIVVGAAGLLLNVYDLGTRRLRKFPVRDYPAKGLITALAVSPDGRYIAYQTADSLSVLDTDRRTSFPVEFLDGVTALKFYTDPDGGVGLAQVRRGGRLSFYSFNGRAFSNAGRRNLGTGARSVWIRNRNEFYWTIGDSVYRGAVGSGANIEVYKGKEPIRHIQVISATGDLLILQQNGIFRIHSPKLGRTVAAGISTRNGWAVIDANKRYDGSEGGSHDIAWVVQETDLDLDKFTKQFYEPGLLLHYVTQLGLDFVARGTKGRIPLPPKINEMKLLENVANSGRSVVFATARNIKAEIANIEVYHNGKLIRPDHKMVDKKFTKDEINVRSIAYEVMPVAGPNVVSVVGVGAMGVEGPTRELSFNRPGRASNDLHIVAVGIDRYAAPELKLGYARNDAAAIGELMKKTSGFDKVTLTELFDGKAGRERVLETLRKVAGASRPGDTIVVYLAGHGIALRGGWYYLSPAIARVTAAEIVRMSVSAKQIAAALQGANARNVILMIDTCNSGAVVKDFKGLLQYRIYNRISREIGVAVLAASRRDQGAYERATLGHGVFTAAMISALSGAADRNADRRITARELVAYASREIPTLAIEHLNEIQIPVAYAPSNDFVVRSLR